MQNIISWFIYEKEDCQVEMRLTSLSKTSFSSKTIFTLNTIHKNTCSCSATSDYSDRAYKNVFFQIKLDTHRPNPLYGPSLLPQLS